MLPTGHDPRGDRDGNESNGVLNDKHDGIQAFWRHDAACFQDQLYNFLKGRLQGDGDAEKNQQAPPGALAGGADEYLLCPLCPHGAHLRAALTYRNGRFLANLLD